MEIRRSFRVDGNLVPRAWNVVKVIPENMLHHRARAKRHPVSVYQASLRAITQAWTVVASDLDRLKLEHLNNESDAYPRLLSSYALLLHRLNEHFDAAYSILRSLLPVETENEPRFDEQLLSRRNPPGWKKFKEAVHSYKQNHIGRLSNAMKHDQAELLGLAFSTSSDYRPGYYLRAVHQDGSIGPADDLHIGGRSAFSFSRDLFLHLWWLFKVDDLLATTIEVIVRSAHSYEIPLVSVPYPDDEFLSVLQFMNRVDWHFFPDELEKPFPKVLLGEDRLRLAFGSWTRGRSFPREAKITTSFGVDTGHLCNRLPYLGSADLASSPDAAQRNPGQADGQ